MVQSVYFTLYKYLLSAVVVLQLFDNSVYLVGTPGGEKHLPRRDRHGAYHIDGDDGQVSSEELGDDAHASLQSVGVQPEDCADSPSTLLGWTLLQ